MGRLLPCDPTLLLLLAAVIAGVRCAPVYGNQLVDMQYHMGPVVSGVPTNLYLIWYGRWEAPAQAVLRDFLASLSASAPFPAVSDWWSRTPRLYTDQSGANVTATFAVAGEHSDAGYSHGASLRRIDVQSIIRSAVVAYPDPLPLDPYDGVYLVLTSPDVQMQEFCRAICGFHYFTFASVVGVTVPYAWVGNSATQCSGRCAYPFALPEYGAGAGGQVVLQPSNGDDGVDGMVIVLGHELAELATNPLMNAWYAGDTPTSPTEIAAALAASSATCPAPPTAAPTTSTASTAGGSWCSGSGTPSAARATGPTPGTEAAPFLLGSMAYLSRMDQFMPLCSMALQQQQQQQWRFNGWMGV